MRRILALQAGAGLDYARPRCRQQDWSNHAALADALAETGVTVQDPHGLLPLPQGRYLLRGRRGTGTGVTEGDRITESFAHWLHGVWAASALSTTRWKELPELADVCAAAPAVVFAFGTVRKPPLPPRPPKRWLRTTRASVLSAWPSRTLCSTIPLLSVP